MTKPTREHLAGLLYIAENMPLPHPDALSLMRMIEDAKAAPECEAVAWLIPRGEYTLVTLNHGYAAHVMNAVPLYTAPPSHDAVVYWQVRHLDALHGWSDWETIKPTGAYVGQTVETMLGEYRAYIEWGKNYELRPLYTAQPSHDAELVELLADQLTWHQARDKELSKSGRNDIDYHWRRLQHQEQITLIDAKLTELRKDQDQ